MRRAIKSILSSGSFQQSMLAPPARALLRRLDGTVRMSPETRMALQIVDRGHYAYCMMNAARLAARLGHDRISTIEFGVAGGNGLKFMCDFAGDVEEATGVAVDCYGFDTGEGMPPPEGKADLPYWFRSGQYRMDVPALQAKVPTAKLVLGDITDRIAGFLEEYQPAPIGAIFNDTDYWSSTRESLRLFEQVTERPGSFLPRMFMYLDDIIGSQIEMYGPHNGQLLAIEEFNRSQGGVKIHLNQNLLRHNHLNWRFQIYYAHLFEHPDYERYVGGQDQERMEELLELKG